MPTNLDALNISDFDPGGMGAHIAAFPEHLLDGWEIAARAPLPEAESSVRRVVIVAIGGSAIAAHLLQGLMAHEGRASVEVVSTYDLPPYVIGAATLVVALSQSGETEEPRAAYAQAQARDVRRLAITTGGALAEDAARAGDPVWRFTFDGTSRAALGHTLPLLLGAMSRLDLYAEAGPRLGMAVERLISMQQDLGPAVPLEANPAKQLARALHGRLPAIFGAGFLEPVARRWKGQCNENAKQWALWDEMPELNHNTVAGLALPSALVPQLVALLLRSALDHRRIQVRWDATHELLRRAGVTVHEIKGAGETALEQMLSLIHFGDFVSYYLAALNGVDPTPVENILHLKARLAEV